MKSKAERRRVGMWDLFKRAWRRFMAPFFFVACAGLAEQWMGKRARHEASM